MNKYNIGEYVIVSDFKGAVEVKSIFNNGNEIKYVINNKNRFYEIPEYRILRKATLYEI